MFTSGIVVNVLKIFLFALFFFFNVFQSFIVLLYILDNETDLVVIISVFVVLLIDLWKVTKVVKVKVDQIEEVPFETVLSFSLKKLLTQCKNLMIVMIVTCLIDGLHYIESLQYIMILNQ